VPAEESKFDSDTNAVEEDPAEVLRQALDSNDVSLPELLFANAFKSSNLPVSTEVS
jgi:hypothetical protein